MIAKTGLEFISHRKGYFASYDSNELNVETVKQLDSTSKTLLLRGLK